MNDNKAIDPDLGKDTSKQNNGINLKKTSKIPIYVGGLFGVAGISLVAISVPFLLPALRKHCLPYVPATDSQLTNIAKALKKHAEGTSFLDIGSGDGRICRLATSLRLFNQIHGVELNSMLVLFSRFMSLKSGQLGVQKYYHHDLWRFPINRYDNICIFGVDTMMQPLQKYLLDSSSKRQTIFVCRFPFQNIEPIDELGEGIDTVWIYKLPHHGLNGASQINARRQLTFSLPK